MTRLSRLRNNLFCLIGIIILLCPLCLHARGESQSVINLGNSFFKEKSRADIRKRIEKINPVLYSNVFLSERVEVEHLLNYSIQNGYMDGIIKCSNLLGAICLMNGEYVRSTCMHQSALRYAQLEDDTLNIVVSLNYLGHLAMRMNQPAKSMRFFMSALQIAERNIKVKKKYWNTIYFSLAGVGLINLSKMCYPEANEYLYRSLYAAQKAGNISGICDVYLYLGILSERRNDRSKAIQFYRESLGLAARSKIKNQVAIRLGFMADLFAKGGDYNRAVLYYNRALNLYDQHIDRYYLIMTYLGLGEAYLGNKSYEQSEKTIQKVIVLSQQIRSYLLLEKGYSLLSKLHEREGRFRDALFYLKLTKLYQDSLNWKMDYDILTEIQYKYDTRRKENQIEKLKENQSSQKAELKKKGMIMLQLFLLFSFILIVGSVWVYVQRLKVRHRQLVLEQQLLRSQMNPHFVFNILASIQNYMYKEDGRRASFYLGQFASLTRSVLNNSRQEWVLLKDEIKTVESYIVLQKMRFDFNYRIVLDDKIDKEETFLPPMLIQPFIENSVNHGICKISEQGEISLLFTQEGKSLRVEIIDNGPGLKSSLLEKEKNGAAESLGLKVFEERIKNLKNIYRGNFKYQFLDLREEDPAKRGTKIVFLLPMKWEKWI